MIFRFTVVQSKRDSLNNKTQVIFADKETKVMYYYNADPFLGTTVTVLLNKDGTLRIYDKNK